MTEQTDILRYLESIGEQFKHVPPVTNSPLWKRLLCRLLHGSGSLVWCRGPMGWVDWNECRKCGAVHDVG